MYFLNKQIGCAGKEDQSKKVSYSERLDGIETRILSFDLCPNTARRQRLRQRGSGSGWMFMSGEWEQSQWLDEKPILLRARSTLQCACVPSGPAVFHFPTGSAILLRSAFSLWFENRICDTW